MFYIFVKTDITNTNSVLTPCCINEFFIIFPDDGRAESCARVIAAAPPGTRAPRAPRRLLSSISPDAEPEHPLTVLVLAKEGSKKPGPARSLPGAGVLQALPPASRTGTAEGIVKQVLSRPGLTQELMHFS